MKSKIMRKAIVVFGLLGLFAAGSISYAQSTATQTLEPPIAGLKAVHHPDIGNLEEAVRKQIVGLQAALAESAKNPQATPALIAAYANMARVYHAYSFFEPAKECYENVVQLAPDDYRWTYMLGKVAHQQNRFADAADLYNKAIEQNSGYTAAYVNLGKVYFEMDMMEQSEKSFQKALSSSENNPAAIFGLGQIELERKNYTNASLLFQKVLELLPDANRVHYSLALAYRGLGDAEKAKFHLDKQGVVGVRPADPLFDSLDANLSGVRLRLVNGKLAFQAKRYKEAETEFRTALELEPENVSALVNLGATLTVLGDGTGAIELFSKALSLEPENVTARYNLAYLMYLKKDYLQAIGHYKLVLKQNPKDVESRFRLGVSLHRMDLLREAASELGAVYGSQPDYEPVVIELAEVLTRIGEQKQAKDILIKSYQSDPTRGQTIAALSYLLASASDRSLRDGEKALQLSQLLYKSTGLLQHRVTVALSLAELGKCEEAETTTREIIEKAKKDGNTELSASLENILPRFKKGEPCRP